MSCGVRLRVDEPQAVRIGAGEYIPQYTTELPEYTGALAVYPTASAQVLPTANKALRYDITVAPIPSNYGLISWNGTVLTVS